jgi:plastocyanin
MPAAGALALAMVGTVFAASHEIAITDTGYAPETVTVFVGEPVTWTNESNEAHTITSDEGSELDSGTIQPAEAYGHVFDAPGTHTYHCDRHPDEMAGTIVVEAAPATSEPSGSEPIPPAGTLPPNFSPFPSTGTQPPSPSASPAPSEEESAEWPLFAILPALALVGATGAGVYLVMRRRGT